MGCRNKDRVASLQKRSSSNTRTRNTFSSQTCHPFSSLLWHRIHTGEHKDFWKKKFFNCGRKEEMGEKSLRAHGNMSTHGKNSDARQTRGSNSSQHRFCISKATLALHTRRAREEKCNKTLLIKSTPLLLRFQLALSQKQETFQSFLIAVQGLLSFFHPWFFVLFICLLWFLGAFEILFCCLLVLHTQNSLLWNSTAFIHSWFPLGTSHNLCWFLPQCDQYYPPAISKKAQFSTF